MQIFDKLLVLSSNFCNHNMHKLRMPSKNCIFKGIYWTHILLMCLKFAMNSNNNINIQSGLYFQKNTNFINNGAFFNCYIQAILTCYMDRKNGGGVIWEIICKNLQIFVCLTWSKWYLLVMRESDVFSQVSCSFHWALYVEI